MTALARLAAFGPFVVLAAVPAFSATIHVPADQPTIQAGINASSAGDTVLVACGTYLEHDIVLRSSVTLRSEGGEPGCVTINAQGLGRVLSGQDLAPETRIEGLTLTGGALVLPYWGAVLCRGGSPSFSSCLFADNAGAGLVATESSDPVLAACTFARNQRSGMRVEKGGGARLTDCMFEDNWFPGSTPGGGMFADGGNVELLRCTFARNTCGDSGGAVGAWNTANLRIEDCSFTRNSGSAGGAIAMIWSQATIADSQFHGNTAGAGGALFCYDQASMTVTGSTFVGNSAETKGGGAMVDYYAWLNVRSSTFFGNAAPDGGGLHQALGNLTVENTIIAQSPQGGALKCSQPVDPVIRCSDFHGNTGGDWISCAAGLLGLYGNVSADPLFCDAPAGDFRIADASPCAPEHSGGCGLIGAWPVGCGATTVEPTTWGALKHAFRR